MLVCLWRLPNWEGQCLLIQYNLKTIGNLYSQVNQEEQHSLFPNSRKMPFRRLILPYKKYHYMTLWVESLNCQRKLLRHHLFLSQLPFRRNSCSS